MGEIGTLFTFTNALNYLHSDQSNGDSSQAWDDIDFAIEMKSNGTLEVYEYGVAKLSGMSPVPVTYTRGDVLRVGVEYDATLKKNVVKWYRNTTVLYTSSSPSINYPLLLDTSIFSPGSWIHDAYLCSGGGSNPGAGNGSESGKKASMAPSPTSTSARGKGASTPTKSTGKSGNPASINVVNTLIYLHTDQLGSVSVATNATGGVVSRQDFDPWGKVRDPNTQVTQTKRNYTGQKLDGTGLLFYNARYYDPGLGRFVSPDSIVPGASSGAGGAGGTVGAEQNSNTTVDFHETGLVVASNKRSALMIQKGFWFELSEDDQQAASEPWGPMNPQALNRFSYVLNNPIRYTDPTGHITLTRDEALLFFRALGSLIVDLQNRLLTGGVGANAMAGLAALGGPPGQVAALTMSLVSGLTVLTVNEVLKALQFMYDALDIFLRGTAPGDTTNRILFDLDVDLPGCDWCITTQSTLPGKLGERQSTQIPMWVWFTLHQGIPAANSSRIKLDMRLPSRPPNMPRQE